MTGNGLSDEHAVTFELGLAHHLRTKTELDAALKEIADLRAQLKLSETTNEALRSTRNSLESRAESCVVERDLLVRKNAELESLFSIIMATMREFKIPNVPLIRELDVQQ